jgi:glyoxalase superfamily protein
VRPPEGAEWLRRPEQRETSASALNRVHLRAADVAGEADRLVGLGARVLAKVEDWVLADPEDDEFCGQPAR